MSLVDDAIAAAKRAGIDPAAFVAQIQQESGFNPNARSPAGAEGIAQFEPGTAAGLGINPWDPQQALQGAARLMASYVKQYGGDYAKALAAYNAGPGTVQYAVSRGGRNWQQYLPAETQNYIRIILGGKTPQHFTPTTKPPSQPPATPTPHVPSGHPAGTVEPHVTHVDVFGQPTAFSVQKQQTPVRPQPLFKQPQAFSVKPQQTPTPAPKPKTVFGIPFALSVPRQPSTPVAQPKATRPSPPPRPATRIASAPVSQTAKKAQQTGKKVVGGPS